MKRTLSKLSLSRESLRLLSPSALGAVRGGLISSAEPCAGATKAPCGGRNQPSNSLADTVCPSFIFTQCADCQIEYTRIAC